MKRRNTDAFGLLLRIDQGTFILAHNLFLDRFIHLVSVVLHNVVLSLILIVAKGISV